MKKLFFLLVLTSCTAFINDWDMRPSNAVDEVLNIHEKNYVKRLNFKAEVSETGGGGCFGFSLISYGITIERPLTIELARKTLIEGVLELQNEVNSSIRLKEYLAKWPFPLENIKYSIYRRFNGLLYLYPNGSENNEITYAQLIKNVIRYYVDKSRDTLPEKIYEETIEEAMKKVGYKEHSFIN